MGFWTHSFRSRQKHDYDTMSKPMRDFATVSLAGWRFEQRGWRFEQRHDGTGDWNTYGPDGQFHGFNESRENAVRYAMGVMDGSIKPFAVHAGLGDEG